MYEQAEPVRTPRSGPGNRQTSGPLPQPRPVHQSGPRGRVRHGNGRSDKSQEDQEASSHIYEDAEEVKRYATYTSADRTYPGGASGRRGLCGFIRSHRSCLAAGIAVLLSLVAVGLAPLTFINKQEMSQLSFAFDALKRNLDIEQNRTAALEQILYDIRMSLEVFLGPPGPPGEKGAMGQAGRPGERGPRDRWCRLVLRLLGRLDLPGLWAIKGRLDLPEKREQWDRLVMREKGGPWDQWGRLVLRLLVHLGLLERKVPPGLWALQGRLDYREAHSTLLDYLETRTHLDVPF